MGTYRQIFYHIVFGTKHRQPTIKEEHCHQLYNYMFGISKIKNCKLYRINGMPDHLHIFSDLHPSTSLSDYIKDIKVASCIWMKETGLFSNFTNWQDGYAAFTHSIKEKDRIIAYVRNQKEHHKAEDFFTEYKRLLIEQEIEFEEKYLL